MGYRNTTTQEILYSEDFHGNEEEYYEQHLTANKQKSFKIKHIYDFLMEKFRNNLKTYFIMLLMMTAPTIFVIFTSSEIETSKLWYIDKQHSDLYNPPGFQFKDHINSIYWKTTENTNHYSTKIPAPNDIFDLYVYSPYPANQIQDRITDESNFKNVGEYTPNVQANKHIPIVSQWIHTTNNGQNIQAMFTNTAPVYSPLSKQESILYMMILKETYQLKILGIGSATLPNDTYKAVVKLSQAISSKEIMPRSDVKSLVKIEDMILRVSQCIKFLTF